MPRAHLVTRAHARTHETKWSFVSCVRARALHPRPRRDKSVRVLSAADIRHVERAGRKARAPPPGETRSTAAEGPERSGRGGEFKSRLLCARVSGVPAARQVESRLHRPPEPHARRVSPPSPGRRESGLGPWRTSTITPAARPGRNWLVALNNGYFSFPSPPFYYESAKLRPQKRETPHYGLIASFRAYFAHFGGVSSSVMWRVSLPAAAVICGDRNRFHCMASSCCYSCQIIKSNALTTRFRGLFGHFVLTFIIRRVKRGGLSLI